MFLQVDFMLCPVSDLGIIPFQFRKCDLPQHFIVQQYAVPEIVTILTGLRSVGLADF